MNFSTIFMFSLSLRYINLCNFSSTFFKLEAVSARPVPLLPGKFTFNFCRHSWTFARNLLTSSSDNFRDLGTGGALARRMVNLPARLITRLVTTKKSPLSVKTENSWPATCSPAASPSRPPPEASAAGAPPPPPGGASATVGAATACSLAHFGSSSWGATTASRMPSAKPMLLRPSSTADAAAFCALALVFSSFQMNSNGMGSAASRSEAWLCKNASRELSNFGALTSPASSEPAGAAGISSLLDSAAATSEEAPRNSKKRGRGSNN
mmetsp:Transcript_143550/g.357732  ORF Transcript_143550/g.357732 Transcript_143550/m.357732 type:complete len:267 (+) Transcript_143550:87-887(+)